MVGQRRDITLARWAIVAAAGLMAWTLLPAAWADESKIEYGIAAKRPVLQASCKHCPWGALADVLKQIMAPAYDIAICYGCSGENGARYVSKRLMSAEVSDRLFAQGVSTRPDAPVDFGITQAEYVRRAYQGSDGYKKDGPFTNLRLIARIVRPRRSSGSVCPRYRARARRETFADKMDDSAVLLRSEHGRRWRWRAASPSGGGLLSRPRLLA